jgi:hypothetical protein
MEVLVMQASDTPNLIAVSLFALSVYAKVVGLLRKTSLK